ncbi:MAG: 5-formyltetrahydrofolate cyclo-ligase [Candidatus Omnitrophica bacterium]|nr:5-formyltetrahydrofolate cyclo-ligase [Candidatus Omnitrophota bacterium]MBU2474309.1 5-formyltetrahydrofolate cyclo-ligase [Candidatus Omnitrophota bacterium]
MVVNREKQQLRKKLLAKLLSLTNEEIKRRSKDVTNRLSTLPIYRKAKKVMAYYPLKGEVDILEMVRKAIKTKRFFFPVVDKNAKELQVHEVKDLETDFIRGPFGVSQPDPRKTKKCDSNQIDMVIVPGLSFDYQHNRLGRGAGFYDRFLQGLTPSIKKVGIAFDLQIVKSLPAHHSLDQKVDIIVSESEVI